LGKEDVSYLKTISFKRGGNAPERRIHPSWTIAQEGMI